MIGVQKLKNRIVLPALLLAACCLAPSSLHAQNMTALTAANIQNTAGTLLVTGTLYVQPTDANDNPMSFECGGGGAITKNAVAFAITSGAISGASVCNPGAAQPSPYYHFWVVDLTTGSA